MHLQFVIHLAGNVLKVDYRDDANQLLVQLHKQKSGETNSAEELAFTVLVFVNTVLSVSFRQFSKTNKTIGIKLVNHVAYY